MKITLELPDALARRFRAAVPNGRRSKVIAELLSKRLMGHEDRLERAAKKANRLKRITADMKDWEALNQIKY